MRFRGMLKQNDIKKSLSLTKEVFMQTQVNIFVVSVVRPLKIA